MFVEPHPSSNDRNQFTSIIDAYQKEGYGKREVRVIRTV
jgi:hypothetical protein